MFDESITERVGIVLEEHHLRAICKALCAHAHLPYIIEVLALMHNAASTAKWEGMSKL